MCAQNLLTSQRNGNEEILIYTRDRWANNNQSSSSIRRL